MGRLHGDMDLVWGQILPNFQLWQEYGNKSDVAYFMGELWDIGSHRHSIPLRIPIIDLIYGSDMGYPYPIDYPYQLTDVPHAP